MSHIHIQKTKKRLLSSLFVLSCAGLALFVAQFAQNHIFPVNAEEADEIVGFGYDEEGAEFDTSYNINYGGTNINDLIVQEVIKDDYSDLETSYTSPYASQQENQGNTNLCWAYSYTTTLESKIRKEGINASAELSARQLDYLLSKNGFTNNADNIYYKKLNTSLNLDRSLKGAGNFIQASLVSTGKHALVDSVDFSGTGQKINYSNISNQTGEYIPVEYELANGFMYHDEINELNKQENGASLPVYNRELTILHLKKAIKEHGAVAVTTHFQNSENCRAYNAVAGTFTYIDRSTRAERSLCGYGHAITLVGWDDNFDYGGTKTGAFKVLDSSNENIKIALNHSGSLTEYLAYESAIPSFYIPVEVQENTYDHVFDYTDYVSHNTNSNIFTYEFDTGGSHQDIKRISFLQKIYMGGAYYRVSIIGEENEEHKLSETLVYILPGQKSIELETPVTVKGNFKVKVEARTPNFEEVSNHPGVYLNNYISSCQDKTDEDLVRCLFDGENPIIPTTSYEISATENKYDLVSVYTEDTKYNITFLAEDGETVLQNSEVAYGKTPSYSGSLNSYVDSGYTYIPTWEPAITPVTGDKTYTLSYRQEKNYTITFKNDDGTIISEKTDYHYGDKINIPTAPGKTSTGPYDYVFVGWEPELSENAVVTEDKIYTAKYELSYPIEYILDGGVNNSSNPNSYTSHDEIIFKDPAKTDYVFLGWFEDADFSGKKVAGVAKGSTGSITLYAKWEKVPENSQTRTNESDEEVGTADAEKTKTDNPDKTVNTKTTKTDNATITADIPTTGGEEKAESSSLKNPNTGNNANQGGFLEGDFYLGALSIGIFGFVIYLIKSRRKVKTRTRKIMKF